MIESVPSTFLVLLTLSGMPSINHGQHRLLAGAADVGRDGGLVHAVAHEQVAVELPGPAMPSQKIRAG